MSCGAPGMVGQTVLGLMLPPEIAKITQNFLSLVVLIISDWNTSVRKMTTQEDGKKKAIAHSDAIFVT